MSTPYIDHSAVGDSASVSTTVTVSSLLKTQSKSIAALSDENSTAHAPTPKLVPAHITNASGEKIVITSIPVPAGRPKTLIDRMTRPKTRPKIVLMPESEYQKFFAKDSTGQYVGTEPQQEWTEAELDERYGKYKSALPGAPLQVEPPLKAGGGYAASFGYGP